MPNVKYAIRFPDLQSINYNKPISIFSEDSIIRTADTFIKTFNAFGSLTEFIIQKNKTNELSRQLNAQKKRLMLVLITKKNKSGLNLKNILKDYKLNHNLKKKVWSLKQKNLY